MISRRAHLEIAHMELSSRVQLDSRHYDCPRTSSWDIQHITLWESFIYNLIDTSIQIHNVWFGGLRINFMLNFFYSWIDTELSINQNQLGIIIVSGKFWFSQVDAFWTFIIAPNFRVSERKCRNHSRRSDIFHHSRLTLFHFLQWHKLYHHWWLLDDDIELIANHPIWSILRCYNMPL